MTKCIHRVPCQGGWRNRQCNRPNGHGPDKAYCAQHDPKAVANRRAARTKKWEAKQRIERPKWYANEMLELLKQSRDGITVAWLLRRNELIQDIETP